METLFNDSETFMKKRPTEITKQQEIELYNFLANEIIENGWCNHDVEDIILDLKKLSIYFYEGYELAKQLEGYGMECDYLIDSAFINWLDDIYMYHNEILQENVKKWVKANNPMPKFNEGDKIIINERISKSKKAGMTFYITGIRQETASYVLCENKNGNVGSIFPYEKIEECCKKID